MKYYSEKDQWIDLIMRSLLGITTPEEQQYLEDKLSEDIYFQDIYDRLRSGATLRERIFFEREFEESVDYPSIKRKIADLYYKNRKIKQRNRTFTWLSIAGSIALLLGIFLSQTKDTQDSNIVVKNTEENIISDKKYGSLTLPDGHAINLTDIPDLLHSSQIVIKKRDGILTFEDEENTTIESEDIQWLKIDTKTGDYIFTLSDGTKVFVNAESTIEFPNRFEKDKRVVKLSGEAYFEVQPDPTAPFIVLSGEHQVKVLGTKFNIKAYPEEENILTTVVSGKVGISLNYLFDAQKDIQLTAGMQSIYKKDSEKPTTRSVRASDIVAWKDGSFIFNNENIENVLRVLARWYGVKFIYDTLELRDETFDGKIIKDDSLESVLGWFTMANGPKFEFIDNKTIKVIKNKTGSIR